MSTGAMSTGTTTPRAWRLFPRFVLRSAGFPFEWLERLRFTASAAAALEVVQAEALGDDRARREALDRGAAAFEEELGRKRAELRAMVSDERFREAVFLSSPSMYEQSLRSYLGSPADAPRNSKVRRQERKLVSYLQRLCAKNETAGFFGPMNYGGFDRHGGTRLEGAVPGIRRRSAFVAHWAVDALADLVAADVSAEDGARDHLRPRLNPLCRVRGDALEVPAGPGGQGGAAGQGGQGGRGGPGGQGAPRGQGGQGAPRALKLSRAQAAVLRLADGSRTVAEIAGATGLGADGVREAIGPFARARVVSLEMRPHARCADPLGELVRGVAALPSGSASRGRWLRVLGDFEAMRARFERAALPERVDLLAAMEGRFQEVTGGAVPARRGEGRLYADRLLVYEECLGGVARLELGERAVERIEAGLEWAMRLGERYGRAVWADRQEAAREVFLRLSPGGRPVPFATFASAFQGAGGGAAAGEGRAARVVERFEAAVAGAARAEGGDPPVVRFDGPELAGALGAVDGGPPFAERYALPDLMLAAPDAAALEAGAFVPVLSRIHHHMPVWGWLFHFYDDREGLEAELGRSLEGGRAYALMASLEVGRRNKGFYDFPGPVVELSRASGRPRDQVIRASELEVALEGERLVLRRAPAGPEVVLYFSMADEAEHPPYAVFGLPPVLQLPLRPGAHAPRVEVGGLVYLRERWEADISDWAGGEGFGLMVRAARTRRALGVPERVYARRSGERKPFFLDFGDYFLLELMAAGAADDPRAEFTEMLPGPDGLWLRGGGGRYSCELRVGAFGEGRGIESCST